MTYDHPSQARHAAPQGQWLRGDGAVATVICHRIRAARAQGQTTPSLLGGMAIRAGRRPMTKGRGATGRALCLPNRALHSCTSVGLLRRAWTGVKGVGAVEMRALSRSGKTLGADAGASDLEDLIGVLRASRHASPTKQGPLRPLKPCMNGLPAHAPVTLDHRLRRWRPIGLHACTTSAGLKELH